MILQKIGFVLVSAGMVFAGLRVVTAKNLVHTVLWLGLMLALTAATYVMLYAPFMAAIQLILYTGGVLTLMLFGVMLTSRQKGTTIPNEQTRQSAGFVIASLCFGVMASAVLKTPAELMPNAAPKQMTTESLGLSFLTTHVLAFEVLSLLLLAAVLGAIVLARRSDPTATGREEGPRIPARRGELTGG